MGEIEANIKYLRELDFREFDLPVYQRPYRWQTSHVETLLNSLRDNMHKQEYRIGSIIVNPSKDTDKLDVVDGQQRLTTLSLLFMCLEQNSTHRLRCKYPHIESKENIYRNYHYIKKWLKTYETQIEKTQFLNFILDKCSVVEIISPNLSEAFQMFDSQNGRGKELEAINLLKAFHLHAIDKESSRIEVTDEKKTIDRKWEEAVAKTLYKMEKPLLKHLMNELYRIRVWSRKMRAHEFSKSKIKEFKGFQFTGFSSSLPLHNHSFLLYVHFKETGMAAHRAKIHLEDENPFVDINMDIINGKVFFSYVNTYVALYDYLFQTEIPSDNPLLQFRKHFEKYCHGYGGQNRSGDTYLRELYVALVMALFDRFGEENLLKWYPILYSLTYRKRLENKSVYYSTVSDFPKDYFQFIATAIEESGLDQLLQEESKPIECKRLGEQEFSIAEYLINRGCELHINGNDLKYGKRKLKNGEILNKETISEK